MDGRAVFEAHSKWIKEVGHLIDSVANQSSLSLDASMDTYNMMGLVVVNIPAIQELLGKIRGIGSGVATKGSFDTESFIRVQTLFGQLEDMIPVVDQSFNILKQFYPEHSNSYQAEYSNYKQAIGKFKNTTKTQLLDPDKPTISGDAYYAEATTAIKAATKLYDVTDDLFIERLGIL